MGYDGTKITQRWGVEAAQKQEKLWLEKMNQEVFNTITANTCRILTLKRSRQTLATNASIAEIFL